MNTDTKYNKLERVAAGIGDFIMTFTERTAIQNAGTECNGNRKEDARENIQGL